MTLTHTLKALLQNLSIKGLKTYFKYVSSVVRSKKSGALGKASLHTGSTRIHFYKMVWLTSSPEVGCRGFGHRVHIVKLPFRPFTKFGVLHTAPLFSES